MSIERDRKIRIKYSGYRYRTRVKKNREFNMTYQEFYDLAIQPCVYCGGFNKNGINGVNRVDNNIGYTPGNITSCCGMCGMMKNAYSKIDFLDKIEKIHRYQY